LLVDILRICDRPLRQRWRWAAAELTEVSEDELEMRPSRRPTLRQKHDLVVGLLGDQMQQITIH